MTEFYIPLTTPAACRDEKEILEGYAEIYSKKLNMSNVSTKSTRMKRYSKKVEKNNNKKTN